MPFKRNRNVAIEYTYVHELCPGNFEALKERGVMRWNAPHLL